MPVSNLPVGSGVAVLVGLGVAVAVGETGVSEAVGLGNAPPHPASSNAVNIKQSNRRNSLLQFMFLLLSVLVARA